MGGYTAGLYTGTHGISPGFQLRPSFGASEPVWLPDGGGGASPFRRPAPPRHAHIGMRGLLAGHPGDGLRLCRVFPPGEKRRRDRLEPYTGRKAPAHDYSCDASAFSRIADQRLYRTALLQHVLYRSGADPHGLSALRGRQNAEGPQKRKDDDGRKRPCDRPLPGGGGHSRPLALGDYDHGGHGDGAEQGVRCEIFVSALSAGHHRREHTDACEIF